MTESPLRLTLGYARQMALWKGVRITVPTSSGLVYVYPEDRGLGLCLRSRPPLKGGQAARPCTPFLLPPEQDGRSSSTTSSCQPGLAGAFPGCACSLASSLWQWTARTVPSSPQEETQGLDCSFKHLPSGNTCVLFQSRRTSPELSISSFFFHAAWLLQPLLNANF